MSGFASRFPRVRQYWLDLETAGLQSASYLWGVEPGASEYGPAISEFAFGRGGHRGRIHGYTNLVNPQLLTGVKPKDLRRGGRLPENLVSQLTADGPEHWNRSVAEDGILGRVFRRHARHVMKGRKTHDLSSLVTGMLDQFDRDIAKGRTPEVFGWNITGFDMPTIHGQLRLHAQRTGSDALLKRFQTTMSKVNIREASEVYHSLLYKRMLKTDFTPVISNRAAMNAAAQQGIREFHSVAQARKAGALVDHSPLRAFMDDVRGHLEGRSTFQSRAEKWAAQFMGAEEARRVGLAMQAELGTVGGTLETFYETARRLTSRRTRSLMPGMTHSAFDVANMMYQPVGQGHMNLITSPDALGVSGRTPVTALNFAGGGKQGQVGASFVQAAKEMGYQSRDLVKLERRLVRGHVAETDRQALKLLYRSMSRAPENVLERMSDIHLNVGKAGRLGLERVNETMRDVTQRLSERRSAAAGARGATTGAQAGALKTAANTAKNTTRQILAHTPRGWLMGAGVAVAGIAFLGERNKPKAPIQGLRDPHSDYREFEGIRASDLPFANVSGFGSGYDHDSFMGPDKVRIVRVIDGDTVQFYRKGKLVTGRLAGINAAETNDLAGYVRKDALKARRYLSDLVENQNVWVRQQVGDPVDTYGRELVFLDVNGLSANAEMVRQGYSGASSSFPEPYYGPGDFIGRLKHIMKSDTEAAISMLRRSPIGGLLPFSTDLPDRVAPEYDSSIENFAPEPQSYGHSFQHPNDNTNGSGYAGLASEMFENANMSKIRDHATQLRRLPGMPRTPRGNLSAAGYGHSEMAAFRNG